MNDYLFTIEPEDAGVRTDIYLNDMLEDYSRSYLQKLMKEGCVTMGERALKPSYILQTGDTISVRVPKQKELPVLAKNIPLDIIYEDSELLIVNKPKGMVVHPAPGHMDDTLVNAILFHCKDGLSGINGVLRPGIVHRIDKDTSGSLIVCKTDSAHRSIAEQLREHSIKRIYHAIVIGSLKEQDGRIDRPLGRDQKNRLKMAVVQGGRRAVTDYKVLAATSGFNYISCRLETGRTHQIRVHMASLGHPVLGDELYGGKKKAGIHCEGQILHAKTIGFIHPTLGEYMEFDTPLPEYFKNALTHLF